MSVNKVILVGNLGKSPETRYTGSGEAVCNFTLATSEKFKNRAGEQQSRTEWHRIVIWGKQAEIAQQYLHKGSLVFVEGSIRSREYESGGTKKTAFEIICSNFRMLDKKESSERSEGGQGDAYEATDADVGF